MELIPGMTVIFGVTEQKWRQPFTMKRHHIYDTRSIVLRGTVKSSTDHEFKVELFGNNGFEKDGQTFVFNRGQILCNQEFKEFNKFGVWSE